MLLVGGGGQANGGIRSGERMGGMFEHLHQQASMNANLNQQPFGNQMMNHNFSENISSQSMVEQNVQGIMDHLSMLQDRIQQLQTLVPLIAQTAHCQTDSNVVAQQQAASAAVVSIISQLAMTAIGLLSQPILGNTGGPVVQSTELPLSQLLQAAVNPTASLFQNTLGSDLRGHSRGASINNLLNNNIFGTSTAAAAVSGVNTGVNARRSFSSGGGGHSFPGLNNDPDHLGQQNPTGQQPGGSSNSPAMSLHNQMTNNGAGKDFGSAGGSGGKNPGGAVNPSSILNSPLEPGPTANNFISELGGMNTGLEDLDNDSRVDDEDSDGENLPPGSFDLVELDATEILAEHTHFCEICGKGFKRDANLRMHMRGHGDEYKTPAALARPDRGTQDRTVTRSRRFSCPYVGCKRNKKHRKFQPLKTMLCVKNHYRRSHCPKVLTCQKCMAKKFSVVADLKTHEKHCGRDKWLCSCGTTFSRKDKLFGHIGLFQGHTPAMPIHELEGVSGGAGGSGNGNGNTPVQEHQELPSEGSFGSETKSSMRFWD